MGEDVNQVLEEMAERKVRRMPVQNDRNQLVGIVSIGDIVASKRECHEVGHALHDICIHGGQHSQSAELSGRA